MDGNGRWATAKGLDRHEGHPKGMTALEKIVEACPDLGIRYLTVYAFSTENRNRPQKEVHALMELLAVGLKTYVPKLRREGVALKMIGEWDDIPAPTAELFKESIRETASGNKLDLVLAFGYSAHRELQLAALKMAQDVASGALPLQQIQEQPVLLERYLQTAQLPPVDFLIRTGGEQRLSNFLLYQLAYAELYFTPVLWPDFTPAELAKALEWFRSRDRRFGGLSEQHLPTP